MRNNGDRLSKPHYQFRILIAMERNEMERNGYDGNELKWIGSEIKGKVYV